MKFFAAGHTINVLIKYCNDCLLFTTAAKLGESALSALKTRNVVKGTRGTLGDAKTVK